MKLLFDQNLSPRLVQGLADRFPESVHIFSLGMGSDDDRTIRDYAARNDFIVVTKDADYGEMYSLYGSPPVVIWIRRGNCATADIEQILRQHFDDIERLHDNPDSGILTLY